MEALFASGRIVDLILLCVAGEALLLALLRRRLGGRTGLAALLATLASGAGLMLALRAALTGAGWPTVAGWMLAALAGHAADLGLRARAAARACANAPGRDAAGARTQEQARRGPRSRAAA